VGSSRSDEVHADALRRTDALVGELLDRVDEERDAVVVVAPSVADEPRLTVLGVRAAEYKPGLLVSGATRQDGFVTLADVTPTIASLAGAEIDESSIEGRVVEVADRTGSGRDRRLRLEEADEAARFRDRILLPVAATFITGVCLLAIATAVMLWWGRIRIDGLVEYASLALLAALPVTYIASLFPFHDWGVGAYAAFVTAGALVLGGVYMALRGSWLRPLVAAYAVLLGVITLSVVLLKSRLQLGAVFGDSAIIAGRFSGINNVTFAQVMIAAIVLAAIAVRAIPGKRGRVVMVALLAGVLIVDGAPMWGADVGGALAGVPALALVAAGLVRWRVRPRTVLLWCAGAVLVVVVFGLLDLTRDAADRTHLGRFFERVGDDGFGGFSTVVERKLATNFRSLTGSIWRWILGPVILVAIALVWKAPSRLRALGDAFPEARAVLPGLLAIGVLGYAVNDSGIAVPGMMIAALVPAVVYLLFRTSEPPKPTTEAGSHS
jgi:hypothetical protein